MNAKRPFRIIRVFDYPKWPRSTLPRIIGIVLYVVYSAENQIPFRVNML
jgi:hypothetical protein